MLLAIDVGNTNITLCLFEGTHIAYRFRVESVRGRTADEYAILIQQLLALHNVDANQIHACVLASVVPSLSHAMLEMVRRSFNMEPYIIDAATQLGITIDVDQPSEVGIDRLVNVVAAYAQRLPTALHAGVLVIDFGTATTFDIISPKGVFVGGAICPGIHICAEALFSRTAKLPRVELVRPARAIGKNTRHAIQSGLVYGYISLVDGMVDRLRNELDFPIRVLATGGLARLVAQASRTIEEVDEDLTMVGLHLLYEQNS